MDHGKETGTKTHMSVCSNIMEHWHCVCDNLQQKHLWCVCPITGWLIETASFFKCKLSKCGAYMGKEWLWLTWNIWVLMLCTILHFSNPVSSECTQSTDTITPSRATSGWVLCSDKHCIEMELQHLWAETGTQMLLCAVELQFWNCFPFQMSFCFDSGEELQWHQAGNFITRVN